MTDISTSIAGFEAMGELAVKDFVMNSPLDVDVVELQRAKLWLERKISERQEQLQISAKNAAWASALAAFLSAIATVIAAIAAYLAVFSKP